MDSQVSSQETEAPPDQPAPRRSYLTDAKVERIIKHAATDWGQIDLDTGRLRVRRLKSGEASVHPLGGREIRQSSETAPGAPFGRYVFSHRPRRRAANSSNV